MILNYIKSPVFIYMIKCMVGISICYTLYKQFPQHQFYWSMISVLLVLAPDDKDANRLASDRMKANILGSTIGLGFFLIHPLNLFVICLGIILTIIIGTALKLDTLRSALAAFLIVMINEQETNSWSIAFERMLCVIAGCLIALLLTRISSSIFKVRTPPEELSD